MGACCVVETLTTFRNVGTRLSSRTELWMVAGQKRRLCSFFFYPWRLVPTAHQKTIWIDANTPRTPDSARDQASKQRKR